MRATQIFWKTLKEAPSGIDSRGQNNLIRAGLLRSPSPGAWTYLPLGWRVLDHLMHGLSRIAGGLGAEPVSFPPSVSPEADSVIWAWDLAEHELRSYKHLPRLLYDQAPYSKGQGGARHGLLGSNPSRRWILFGFYADQETASVGQTAARRELEMSISGLGLRVVLAHAGSHDTRAWLFEHETGDTPFFRCAGCGRTSLPRATTVAPPPADASPMRDPEDVETPGCTTIAGLAEFLGIPESQTMKVVFYATAEGVVVCAVIRGDLNIDEGKLSAVLGGQALRPGRDDELRAIGSVAGYGSPVGLRRSQIIVDPTVMAARNLVAGANREPYHTLNINPRRDFRVDRVVDLREARAGDPCADCSGSLTAGRAFELGMERVGTSEDAGYLDEAGAKKPIVLVETAIDLDHLLGAVAETHHDDDGLRWPAAIAPAQVYLLGIKIKADPTTAEAAERVYERLRNAGATVLYDDRDERPGVAFKDADLLGLPLRLTVSQRSLEAGGIEVKWRDQAERTILAEDDLEQLLGQLMQ